jgi:hypothetical protein
MTSIFFAAGLGLGFVLGIAVGLLCWILATKVSEAKYKNQILSLRQAQGQQRQQLEQTVKEMTHNFGNGPALSERHKQVLTEELAAVVTKGRR